MCVPMNSVATGPEAWLDHVALLLVLWQELAMASSSVAYSSPDAEDAVLAVSAQAWI